jgi:hypothetical protein
MSLLIGPLCLFEGEKQVVKENERYSISRSCSFELLINFSIEMQGSKIMFSDQEEDF